MHSSIPSKRLRKLGVIAAPGWFDPTAGEFMVRRADALEATQTILPPPGFDWSFEQIAQSEPGLETAARLLAEAGCEVIAQVGPAFAYRIGGSVDGARALGQRLSEACGAPVVLNGVAVLDALRETGCRRIAVSCPYYSQPWKQGFVQFLEQQGFSVAAAQTFVDQGIFARQEEVSARNYAFTESEVMASVRRTRASAPSAEAVVVSGSGVRTLNWVEELEREFGIPIIAADLALYRAVLKTLDLRPNTKLRERVGLAAGET